MRYQQMSSKKPVGADNAQTMLSLVSTPTKLTEAAMVPWECVRTDLIASTIHHICPKKDESRVTIVYFSIRLDRYWRAWFAEHVL